MYLFAASPGEYLFFMAGETKCAAIVGFDKGFCIQVVVGKCKIGMAVYTTSGSSGDVNIMTGTTLQYSSIQHIMTYSPT